jgi:hypothetical protein
MTILENAKLLYRATHHFRRDHHLSALMELRVARMEKPILAERDRIAADVKALKRGAAEISQLVAEELRSGDTGNGPSASWRSVEPSESDSMTALVLSMQRLR